MGKSKHLRQREPVSGPQSLEDLQPKAQPKYSSTAMSRNSSSSELVSKGVALLALAALSSPVSQASLAPLYGAIPSSVNHATALKASASLGLVLHHLLDGQWTSTHSLRAAQYAATLAPLLWTLLKRYSGHLGPVVGPAITDFLTCHCVVAPSVFTAAQNLSQLSFLRQRTQGYNSRLVVNLAAALAIFVLFTALERGFEQLVPRVMGYSPSLLAPIAIQTYISLALLLMNFSWPAAAVFLAVQIAITNSTFFSHSPLHLGATSLPIPIAGLNWTLLARTRSRTGYISVLEDHTRDVRFLRCDHSLLGGEWLLTASRHTTERWTQNEPIYAVFEMLEAVRLIENSHHTPDAKAHALVIGLGIGTAPKALLVHGINTTIVELDPAVHAFATTYFGLPTNHTAVLRDAIGWVAEQNRESASSNPEERKRYDYILHDVFTGGAEPFQLFTAEFLRGLRALLQPHGVAAINYAGSLQDELTKRVVFTVDTVFDGQCRMFSDSPSSTSSSSSKMKEKHDGFANFVIFCRNSPGKIVFRKPTAADFLGSISRQHYLLPRPEAEVDIHLWSKSSKAAAAKTDTEEAGSLSVDDENLLLHEHDEAAWRSQQVASALKHWHIMRTVLPDAIWENPLG